MEFRKKTSHERCTVVILYKTHTDFDLLLVRVDNTEYSKKRRKHFRSYIISEMMYAPVFESAALSVKSGE